MIVPDTLVALKCFLPEACGDKALTSLEGHISGAIAVASLLFNLAW